MRKDFPLAELRLLKHLKIRFRNSQELTWTINSLNSPYLESLEVYVNDNSPLQLPFPPLAKFPQLKKLTLIGEPKYALSPDSLIGVSLKEFNSFSDSWVIWPYQPIPILAAHESLQSLTVHVGWKDDLSLLKQLRNLEYLGVTGNYHVIELLKTAKALPKLSALAVTPEIESPSSNGKAPARLAGGKSQSLSAIEREIRSLKIPLKDLTHKMPYSSDLLNATLESFPELESLTLTFYPSYHSSQLYSDLEPLGRCLPLLRDFTFDYQAWDIKPPTPRQLDSILERAPGLKAFRFSPWVMDRARPCGMRDARANLKVYSEVAKWRGVDLEIIPLRPLFNDKVPFSDNLTQ